MQGTVEKKTEKIKTIKAEENGYAKKASYSCLTTVFKVIGQT